jgi:hypothetical protein
MMMEPRVPIAYGKVRKAWTLPEELLVDLEAWRAAQRPIPTESQAVAELLARAIVAWRQERELEPAVLEAFERQVQAVTKPAKPPKPTKPRRRL